MSEQQDFVGSILMPSIHGYVAAEPELGRPDTGGQVTFVLELAKCLAALGYRVDILTRRFDDQPEVDPIDRGLRVWRVPFGGPDFLRKEDMHDHLDELLANLLAEIKSRELSYDLVSSHYWDAGWLGQQVAEHLKIPHVHTPHSLGSWKKQDMEGLPAETREGFRFDERIEKEFLVYRHADQVVATTHQQADILGRDYGLPAGQVTVIPPGMDESRFTPVRPEELGALRRRLGFRQTDVYSVGRAATNKGYGLLIRSLPAVQELVPNVRLRLAVGANSSQDRRLIRRWQSLAQELGVAERVKWLGYVPDDAMADHYRAAGVFALASRYEPFGMTAIEAMGCGTPTVVTVHGGLHELIDFGEQALFADPKRPVELAAMLSLPLRYPRLRDRLSIEGARFARRHFGWMGIAGRTAELFESFRGRYRNLWQRKGGETKDRRLPAEPESDGRIQPRRDSGSSASNSAGTVSSVRVM